MESERLLGVHPKYSKFKAGYQKAAYVFPHNGMPYYKETLISSLRAEFLLINRSMLKYILDITEIDHL